MTSREMSDRGKMGELMRARQMETQPRRFQILKTREKEYLQQKFGLAKQLTELLYGKVNKKEKDKIPDTPITYEEIMNYKGQDEKEMLNSRQLEKKSRLQTNPFKLESMNKAEKQQDEVVSTLPGNNKPNKLWQNFQIPGIPEIAELGTSIHLNAKYIHSYFSLTSNVNAGIYGELADIEERLRKFLAQRARYFKEHALQEYKQYYGNIESFNKEYGMEIKHDKLFYFKLFIRAWIKKGVGVKELRNHLGMKLLPSSRYRVTMGVVSRVCWRLLERYMKTNTYHNNIEPIAATEMEKLMTPFYHTEKYFGPKMKIMITKYLKIIFGMEDKHTLNHDEILYMFFGLRSKLFERVNGKQGEVQLTKNGDIIEALDEDCPPQYEVPYTPYIYNLHTHVKEFQMITYIHKYIRVTKGGNMDFPWTQQMQIVILKLFLTFKSYKQVLAFLKKELSDSVDLKQLNRSFKYKMDTFFRKIIRYIQYSFWSLLVQNGITHAPFYEYKFLTMNSKEKEIMILRVTSTNVRLLMADFYLNNFFINEGDDQIYKEYRIEKKQRQLKSMKLEYMEQGFRKSNNEEIKRPKSLRQERQEAEYKICYIKHIIQGFIEGLQYKRHLGILTDEELKQQDRLFKISSLKITKYDYPELKKITATPDYKKPWEKCFNENFNNSFFGDKSNTPKPIKPFRPPRPEHYPYIPYNLGQLLEMSYPGYQPTQDTSIIQVQFLKKSKIYPLIKKSMVILPNNCLNFLQSDDMINVSLALYFSEKNQLMAFKLFKQIVWKIMNNTYEKFRYMIDLVKWKSFISKGLRKIIKLAQNHLMLILSLYEIEKVPFNYKKFLSLSKNEKQTFCETTMSVSSKLMLIEFYFGELAKYEKQQNMKLERIRKRIDRKQQQISTGNAQNTINNENQFEDEMLSQQELTSGDESQQQEGQKNDENYIHQNHETTQQDSIVNQSELLNSIEQESNASDFLTKVKKEFDNRSQAESRSMKSAKQSQKVKNKPSSKDSSSNKLQNVSKSSKIYQNPSSFLHPQFEDKKLRPRLIKSPSLELIIQYRFQYLNYVIQSLFGSLRQKSYLPNVMHFTKYQEERQYFFGEIIESMMKEDKSSSVSYGIGRNIVELLSSDEKMEREIKRKIKSLSRKATLLWNQMFPNDEGGNVKVQNKIGSNEMMKKNSDLIGDSGEKVQSPLIPAEEQTDEYVKNHPIPIPAYVADSSYFNIIDRQREYFHVYKNLMQRKREEELQNQRLREYKKLHPNEEIKLYPPIEQMTEETILEKRYECFYEEWLYLNSLIFQDMKMNEMGRRAKGGLKEPPNSFRKQFFAMLDEDAAQKMGLKGARDNISQFQ